MEYKDLATLYHIDSSSSRESSIQKILRDRMESDSTFNLGFSLPSGELFLAVPRELSALTQKVLRRERKVSNLMRSLPGIAGSEVLRSLAFDEVVMSNRVENIHSTRKQIEDALEIKDSNKTRVKRFREFAQLYIDLILEDYERPQSPEDIRGIYDKVMKGENLDMPPDGRLFRKDTVTITDDVKVIHNGLHPEEAIIEAMEAMLKLVNSSDVPELYSALISHYIFEYAHPFYDGNGRTGRYLLAMYLETPLSKPTALSLSRVIAENKSQYYHAFQNVEDPLNHAEITFFVITMHELILKAQDELIDRLEKNIATLEMINDLLGDLSDSEAYKTKELDILYALLQQSAFGVTSSMKASMLSEHIGLGSQQARKYLSKLEEDGIVEKTRGKNPMMFALTEKALEKIGIEL